jgi:hypothetical protein
MNSAAVDISHIPFSRYRTYVSVTAEEGKKPLAIHNVRKRFTEGSAFEVLPLRDARVVDYHISLFLWKNAPFLRLRCGKGGIIFPGLGRGN